ncbi:Imm1 family immunity protein [Actinokineospora sp. G85]
MRTADELDAYMSNLGEVPADFEVPIDVVRQGLHESLATGTRPSVLRED